MELVQAEGKDKALKWEPGRHCPYVSGRVHMQHALALAVAAQPASALRRLKACFHTGGLCSIWAL